ncbi:MAG: plasmid mobilization protein [Ruminococcus sp.]
MTNRKRNHSICLKLSDEEYSLWDRKQKASGLSKTDFLIKAIKNSNVRVYSVEESVRLLIHEIRKTGTNLNQLAYFSNIGQEEKVRNELRAIRLANDKVMEQLSDFLKNPKFDVKELS